MRFSRGIETNIGIELILAQLSSLCLCTVYFSNIDSQSLFQIAGVGERVCDCVCLLKYIYIYIREWVKTLSLYPPNRYVHKTNPLPLPPLAFCFNFLFCFSLFKEEGFDFFWHPAFEGLLFGWWEKSLNREESWILIFFF